MGFANRFGNRRRIAREQDKVPFSRVFWPGGCERLAEKFLFHFLLGLPASAALARVRALAAREKHIVSRMWKRRIGTRPDQGETSCNRYRSRAQDVETRR